MSNREHIQNAEILPLEVVELMTPEGSDMSETITRLEFARYMHEEPSRKHHVFDGHVTEMMLFIFGQRERLANPRVALWAAVYHDCVYDTHAKPAENERESADVAVAQLYEFLPHEETMLVEDYIVATAEHRAGTDDFDLLLLLDADMAILGAETLKYDEYAANIRAEYGWVDDEVYRKERKKVLQGFLNRDDIFQTELAKDMFEAQARENMEREITRLNS